MLSNVEDLEQGMPYFLRKAYKKEKCMIPLLKIMMDLTDPYLQKNF